MVAPPATRPQDTLALTWRPASNAAAPRQADQPPAPGRRRQPVALQTAKDQHDLTDVTSLLTRRNRPPQKTCARAAKPHTE